MTKEPHPELDIQVFNELLIDSDGHRHRNPKGCSACLNRWRQAALLYRGELLAHFYTSDAEPFESWRELQRQSLREQALTLFVRFALCAFRFAPCALRFPLSPLFEVCTLPALRYIHGNLESPPPFKSPFAGCLQT